MRPFKHCLYLNYAPKSYVCMHVKFTRQWESTLIHLPRREQYPIREHSCSRQSSNIHNTPTPGAQQSYFPFSLSYFTLKSVLRYRFASFKASFCVFAHVRPIPFSPSWCTTFTRSSNACAPEQLTQFNLYNDLRVEVEQTCRILSSVLRLMGVKSCSAEYFWYWQTIRSGIMFRTTFGTWTTSLVDNVIVLAPNGRS